MSQDLFGGMVQCFGKVCHKMRLDKESDPTSLEKQLKKLVSQFIQQTLPVGKTMYTIHPYKTKATLVALCSSNWRQVVLFLHNFNSRSFC